MSSVTLFSGTFCNTDRVVGLLEQAGGFRVVTDSDIVRRASTRSGIAESKLIRAFQAHTSVFNSFTHEKERYIAELRLAVAETLGEDQLLLEGFASHLVDPAIAHVLRVCLIADTPARLATARADLELGDKEALKILRRDEEDCTAWVEATRRTKDPWDAKLYDILIPTDKIGAEGAVAMIEENLGKAVVRATDRSRAAVEDSLLAARVDVALAEHGHSMAVRASGGAVRVIINRNVLLLRRLEDELQEIASAVVGVESVTTEVGEGFHQADVYRRYDFEAPSRVLLVDDEREFVQTLSERLMMRDVGSAVAYDGESALMMVEEDEPEVMILDLKMPGIDGIEVLRRVKQTRPEIEVIILTGHGTDSDRQQCMELGAFAYLQKPVDIDVLSESLRKANEKARANIGGRGE